MENIDQEKENWTETKGRLKQKFASLTENDFCLLESKQDELFGRLQVKLGKTKEELQSILSSL